MYMHVDIVDYTPNIIGPGLKLLNVQIKSELATIAMAIFLSRRTCATVRLKPESDVLFMLIRVLVLERHAATIRASTK